MITGAHSIIYSKNPQADRGFLKDVASRVAARGRACSPVRDMGWGRLTQVSLPGGGKLGVYEPCHARPKPVAAAPSRKKPPRAPVGKKAKARKP